MACAKAMMRNRCVNESQVIRVSRNLIEKGCVN